MFVGTAKQVLLRIATASTVHVALRSTGVIVRTLVGSSSHHCSGDVAFDVNILGEDSGMTMSE